MNPTEQETAIGQLEERLERLRILYDQYFLGFERLEPGVPRKDVDRRFAALRKEKIRNTAIRFRLNVLTQRYNTYQMFWQRICRQIEEGTYKRHIRRARERLGASSKPTEISVEVDLAEFEDANLRALLAEADRAAEEYERKERDTLPPGALEDPPDTPQRLPESDMRPVGRSVHPAALSESARPRVVRRAEPAPREPASSPLRRATIPPPPSLLPPPLPSRLPRSK